MPAPWRELTSIIDEETDRLSLLVSDAVRMAQIDAGKIRSIGASASERAISASRAAAPSAGPGAIAASNRARSEGAAAVSSSSPAGSASPGIGSAVGDDPCAAALLRSPVSR